MDCLKKLLSHKYAWKCLNLCFFILIYSWIEKQIGHPTIGRYEYLENDNTKFKKKKEEVEHPKFVQD